jgi:hypothetical protein
MPCNGTPSRALAASIVAKFKTIPRWQLFIGVWSEAHFSEQIEAAIQQHVERQVWWRFNAAPPPRPPEPGD